MKKILLLMLLMVLVLNFTACTNITSENSELVNEEATQNSTDTKVEESESSDVSKNEANEKEEVELNSEFKSAMDTYEKFIDEYIAFMKKYKDNPSDFSLLTKYSEYISKYSDFVSKFSEWENKNLTSDELAYYIDVQARVSKKLLEVA